MLVVPAILFGLLVAAQWGTFGSAVRDELAIRYVEPLHSSVSQLQTEQDSLKADLATLRGELEELQRTAAQQTGATADLQQRLEALREAAGLTEVRGEGLVVAFEPLPVATEPERRSCLAPDLTDIVNAAWRSGATAISINGERVVSSSSMYCVGSTIVVNGSLTSAPFEIRAIGDAQRLMSTYDDPQQLSDLKRRRDERTVTLRATREQSVTIGAYSGPIAVSAARLQ